MTIDRTCPYLFHTDPCFLFQYIALETELIASCTAIKKMFGALLLMTGPSISLVYSCIFVRDFCNLLAELEDVVVMAALVPWKGSYPIWMFNWCDFQSENIMAHNETFSSSATFLVAFRLSSLSSQGIFQYWLGIFQNILLLHVMRVQYCCLHLTDAACCQRTFDTSSSLLMEDDFFECCMAGHSSDKNFGGGVV